MKFRTLAVLALSSSALLNCSSNEAATKGGAAEAAGATAAQAGQSGGGAAAAGAPANAAGAGGLSTAAGTSAGGDAAAAGDLGTAGLAGSNPSGGAAGFAGTAGTSSAGSSSGGVGGAGGFAGAAGGSGGAAAYSPCPATGAPCKILPFGDSITFGVGSSGSGSNGGYRVELFHRAHQDQKQITFVGTSTANGPTTVDGVSFPRKNEGHSGFTIDNVAATGTLTARSGISPLVATVMPATEPDIVTLMIGTNDIQHDIDVSNAPSRLAKLLDSIIAANAHTLLVVAQIVPTTDATLNPMVQSFNAAIPALVSARAGAGKHVMMVDLYDAVASDPAFKTSGRTVPDNTVGLMYDWLHPNVAGYKVIGDAWYEAIKTVLH